MTAMILEEQEIFLNGVQKTSNYFVYVAAPDQEAVLWRFFPADHTANFTEEEHRKSVEHVKTFIEPVRKALDLPLRYRKRKNLAHTLVHVETL